MGLFDGRLVRRHQMLVVRAATMIAQEDDRVYRNQVAGLAGLVGPCAPSGLGLLRARLLGVCFPLYPFMRRWAGKRQADVSDMSQALSGVAAAPLMEQGAMPSVDRDSAVAVAGSFMAQQLRLIGAELAEGGSSIAAPDLTLEEARDSARSLQLSQRATSDLLAGLAGEPTTTQFTSGFQGLVASCHAAMAESVGRGRYTEIAQAQLQDSFVASVFGRLRVMMDVYQQLV